jgi:hypothetical protein
MVQTLERALHPVAKRPGLLHPGEVYDLLTARRGWRVRAEDVAECLDRPVDQVLHVLSYMTSLGLLEATRVNGTWMYKLAPLSEAS